MAAMETCGNQIALAKAAALVRRRVVEPCSLTLLTNYARHRSASRLAATGGMTTGRRNATVVFPPPAAVRQFDSYGRTAVAGSRLVEHREAVGRSAARGAVQRAAPKRIFLRSRRADDPTVRCL